MEKLVTLEVEVSVEMDDAVVARGAEYTLDPNQTAEHLARCRVELGISDVSALGGWADIPKGAGRMGWYGLDVIGLVGVDDK